MTQVYGKTKDGWRQVSAQATPILEAAKADDSKKDDMKKDDAAKTEDKKEGEKK